MHRIYSTLKGYKFLDFYGHSGYYQYKNDSSCYQDIGTLDGDGNCYEYNLWWHEGLVQNTTFARQVLELEEEDV